MSLEQIIILAIIQGITEFIPVSSSAHLALAPILGGWRDQGILMDVAAHIGTLGSVLVYFRRDVMALFRGSFSLLRGKITADTSLLFMLVIATIPVVIVGFIFDMLIGDYLRGVTIIAWMSIIFGGILYMADHIAAQSNTIRKIRYSQSLIFGLAQCLSVISGVSRSGITMTAGRLMNFTRVEAAHFAFLMAIPTITAAGVLKSYKLVTSGAIEQFYDASLLAVFSFFIGLATIAFMMRWLQRSTLAPFAVYRIVLGILLLICVYQGYLF